MSVVGSLTGRARVELAAVRTDRARQVVWGAALVGLVIRLVWIARAARQPQPLYDPWRYLGYGTVLGEGRGMIDPITGAWTSYYPPGYPWFLGAIQYVQTRTPLPDGLPKAAALFQVLMSVASIVLVALLARRIHSRAAAGVAAVIMALYPNLVFHTAALLSETLSIFVLLLALVALVPPDDGRAWVDRLSRSRLVVAGLLFGALLLIRPVSGGVILAAGAAALLAGSGWRRALTITATLLLVAGLCVVPWTIRNVIRLDNPTIVSTNTGDNLCIGHAPGSVGAFRYGVPECQTGTGVQDGTAAEVANDREKTRRALRFIREDPGAQPRLVWLRFRSTVERDDDGVRAVQSYNADPWLGESRSLALMRLANGYWYAVGLLGLAGFVLLARERRGEGLLMPLATLGLLAAPLLTFGDARFKMPFVPLVVIAAAAALVTAASWLRTRRDAVPTGSPAPSE